METPQLSAEAREAHAYLKLLGYPPGIVDTLGEEAIRVAEQHDLRAAQPNPDVIKQLEGQWQDVLALALWKLSPSTPLLLSREDGATFDALKGVIVLTVQGHPDGIVLALMPKAMIPT